MTDDALTAALPLMRRMLEARYRIADAGLDASESAAAEAQYEGARDALFRYLVAHGWTPPDVTSDRGATLTLVDVSAVAR